MVLIQTMKTHGIIDHFKRTSEMKNKLKLFSIEIGNSSGGKQHYPHSDKKREKIKRRHIIILIIKKILTPN